MHQLYLPKWKSVQMFDQHTDVITASDFSATDEEMILLPTMLAEAKPQYLQNSLDIDLQLFAHPIKMTLLFWINVLYIKKKFSYSFHCKEHTNHPILVILRSLAVVKDGNWKPTQNNICQVGSHLSGISEHTFVTIQAEFHPSYEHCWNLKMIIHLYGSNSMSALSYYTISKQHCLLASQRTLQVWFREVRMTFRT